jgi:hypothetical protein
MRKERKMTEEEQGVYDFLMAKKPEIIREVIERVKKELEERKAELDG